MSTADDEEEAASAELEHILGVTRPKHVGEGLTRGVSYIVKGAVGACGAALLTPVAAAAEGTREMGMVGGLLGGGVGAVGGAIQAVNMLGGGIVTGVSQVVAGVANTPQAVQQVVMSKSSSGKTGGAVKWWNANEGKWITTNLLDEERWIATQSIYDQDLLGEQAIPQDERTPVDPNQVKDMYYYDKLGLDPSVTNAEMVKRRYYIIARKFSPDRCGANPQAQEEFQQIGRAYMVLSNDELRAKYDRVGREGLWSEEEDTPPPDVDPFKLHAFLFGSEKFNPYIGRLAAATVARVGEEKSKKTTLVQARLLQKRRVTRLALQLSDRLSKWAEDELEQSARADWLTEAQDLCHASYGNELVHVIGKVYSLAAVQFLGSMESGIGMPSIHQWAKKQMETMKHKTQMTTRFSTKDKITLKQNVGTALDKSQGDQELEQKAMEILKNSHLQQNALKWLWTQTVVDITNTLHETAQMVLMDSNVSQDVRKKRGEGLKVLGEIFSSTDLIDQDPEQEGLEEVAFHAMLDTIWRQEKAARAHYKQ